MALMLRFQTNSEADSCLKRKWTLTPLLQMLQLTLLRLH